MKFKDPKTGKVFEDIFEARVAFCIMKSSEECAKCKCKIGFRQNGIEESCTDFCAKYPAEAARLMGYEVIDDTPTEPHDNVNHPAHYTQGGVECIDALAAATEGLEGIQAVCAANAIKYIWRFKGKNGAEDLDKAIWYINRLKEEITHGQNG